MRGRTAQDLLAERRANVLEAMRSDDPTAKENLMAHVAIIDAELERRRRDAEDLALNWRYEVRRLDGTSSRTRDYREALAASGPGDRVYARGGRHLVTIP